MPFVTALLSEAADAAAANITAISLHTGDPGSSGANEVTGGSPAYARKTPVWGAASGGVATQSGSVTFDVPAGVLTHYGAWEGAVFKGGQALSGTTGDRTFTAQGTYTLSGITITATSV